MDYELRLVIEKVEVETQAVVKRDTLEVYGVVSPASILELGLRHIAQISLLQKIQDAILGEQVVYLHPDHTVCPNCHQKLKKNGYQNSEFHAVFSDHRLKLQKHLCKNPDCGFHSTPSIKSRFGTNIHPDLAKLQCEQGALHSYREAQNILERVNTKHRRVNNHNQVKAVTNQVGAILSEENYHPPTPDDCAASATEVIVQVDGGHIPIKEKGKRSFEALAGIVYRPENIQVVDGHHREIVDKTCVLSAQDDELATIKTYLTHAAQKQGMTTATNVTAVADGALNCWAVIAALKPRCKSLECILDWFHIGKKFQNVKNALGEPYEKCLDSAKWTLWHGAVNEALAKLDAIKRTVTDEKPQSKLNGLYDYLKRNQNYMVNYENRKTANQSYTSQVAESHMESVINARHKKKGKMQWTREGAHHVLQIRAAMISDEWISRWQGPVLKSLMVAA